MSNTLLKFRLDGRVALVTGASRGIGQDIARAFSELGARVVLCGRKPEPLAVLAAELTQAGGDVLAVPAHVGDAEARRMLIERTVDHFGGIDILVNNAASNPVFGPVAAVDEAVFDKILAVNLKAPLALARLAYPHFCARGGGAIINVSSVGGIRPEPMLGLYSVSKAALLSLTKVLAAEWGANGIRANAICPGLVRTRFSEALWRDESMLQGFLERVPLGRMASPADIVPMAVFLASDAGAYCTGATFTVDGGLML
jgi:dehydrogenase/reductase SDR family member 4